MEAPQTFASWIRQRRHALDLTQELLAQRLGYSIVTLRKIESGERRASREMAARLADCLAIAEEERAAFLEAARRDPGGTAVAPPVVACPGSRTGSRPDLRAGYEKAAGLLQSYAAMRLLVEQAQERLDELEPTAGNARTIAEICGLLEGLSLAIDLAAARVVMGGSAPIWQEAAGASP